MNIEIISKYATVILAALGLFSVIAKMTPTEADNKVVDFLYKIVNFLGLTKEED